MKIIPATAFTILALASLSAQAGTAIINLSVGGEISPGVYGQVQFGNAPPPPVFYPQPMIIVRQPGMLIEPIYLHVPPGHAKHWAKHCRAYNACNRPVYFIRSAEYEPGYQKHKNKGDRGEGRRSERRGDDGDRGEGHKNKGNRDKNRRD